MSDATLDEPTNPLVAKFEQLENRLNDELVERRPEIFGALLALAAQSTYYTLGQPGIAKSYLVDRLMAYISDATYFNILMHKTSQPEELFGPVSLPALEQGRFEHVIDGYLPTAEVAMIDEIFKCNSSVLNSLLWIINERKYRHGSSVVRAPLRTLFCASNELPADDSLNALYDRLVLRFEVSPIQDQSSFIQMLKTEVVEHPEPILTWADIEKANAEVRAVEIPERVIEVFADLRRSLAEEGIEPSDRRYRQALSIVQAAAWLDDCRIADTDHIAPLEHVLWMAPEQRPVVSRLVLERANPLEVEAAELLAEIRGLESQLDNLSSDEERLRLGNEVHRKVVRAADDLEELQTRIGNGKRRSMKVAEVKDKLARVTERVLHEVFQFDENDAKTMKLTS